MFAHLSGHCHHDPQRDSQFPGWTCAQGGRSVLFLAGSFQSLAVVDRPSTCPSPKEVSTVKTGSLRVWVQPSPSFLCSLYAVPVGGVLQERQHSGGAGPHFIFECLASPWAPAVRGPHFCPLVHAEQDTFSLGTSQGSPFCTRPLALPASLDNVS